MIRTKLIAATAVASALALASTAGAAAVVVGNSGNVRLDAFTKAGPSLDEDHDSDSFTGAPADMSIGVSARATDPHATASLAEDVKAAWASSDHGTVNFSVLASLFSDGAGAFTTAGYNDAGPILTANPFVPYWLYNFTPTEDAVLTLNFSRTITGADVKTFEPSVSLVSDVFSDGFSYFGTNNTVTYDLLAGHAYELSFDSQVNKATSTSSAFDSLILSTFDVTFDIAAAATQPPSSTAVPEPSTWALMLAGFGAVGAALRRRRSRPAVGFAF